MQLSVVGGVRTHLNLLYGVLVEFRFWSCLQKVDCRSP